MNTMTESRHLGSNSVAPNVEQVDRHNDPQMQETENRFKQFLAESGLEKSDVPKWLAVDSLSLSVMLGIDLRRRIKSDGCAIPYHDLNGNVRNHQGIPFYRMRIFQPIMQDDGKQGPKYLSPAGARDAIYIPEKARLRIRDGNASILIITEGEKKADVAGFVNPHISGAEALGG